MRVLLPYLFLPLVFATLFYAFYVVLQEDETRVVKVQLFQVIRRGKSHFVNPKDRRRKLFEGLDRLIIRQTLGTRLKTQLVAADINLKVSEFLLVIGGSTLLGFLIVLSVSRTLAFIGLLLGGLVPFLFVSMRKNQRLRSIEITLADAITVIANSLRSGYSFLQSFENAAREIPGPLGSEFKKVVADNRVGIPLEDALSRLADRVHSTDLDLVMVAVSIQRQTGGDLAEILERIAHTIRERVRLKGEVAAITAQGRLSAWVISVLPFALAFVLSIMHPNYLVPLWQSNFGRLLIFGGLTSEGVGIFFLRKIVRVEDSV